MLFIFKPKRCCEKYNFDINIPIRKICPRLDNNGVFRLNELYTDVSRYIIFKCSLSNVITDVRQLLFEYSGRSIDFHHVNNSAHMLAFSSVKSLNTKNFIPDLLLLCIGVCVDVLFRLHHKSHTHIIQLFIIDFKKIYIY